jgi:hypothetical protein
MGAAQWQFVQRAQAIQIVQNAEKKFGNRSNKKGHSSWVAFFDLINLSVE